MEEYPIPVVLQKVDDKTLKILWSDTTSNTYDVRKLRYNCSCARCINEWSGDRSVKLEDIPLDMKPVKIESVGNYAMRITWSDRHDGGLYSYKNLKEVLPALTKPEPISKETSITKPHQHGENCSHHHD